MCRSVYLYVLERVAHHGDEHVDQDDDDADVVEREQQQSDGLDDAGGAVTGHPTSRRRRRREPLYPAGSLTGGRRRRLGRVADDDAVRTDLTEHAPEQAEQCHRHSANTHPRDVQ